MKLLSIALCLICMLTLLSGCSTRGSAQNAEPAPTVEIEAETPIVLPDPVEEAAAEEKLNALLDGVRGRVFPGTAGSSLSAAACAAEMADFFTESGISPDAVDACVQAYLAALPEEDAQLFEMQLDGLVSGFSNLTGENGAGLLGDCGYESAHFPWEDENVRNCFAALLGTD